jgi:hypothetical protein
MTRRIAHAAQIGALVLALALVPAALAAKGGGGGKPSSGSGGSSSLSLVMVNDLNGNGAPNYGDTVTFSISTTATTSPYVNLSCYQNGVLVASADSGFFSGYPWATQNMTLKTTLWTGGAADCTATLYYYGSKKVTLAKLPFRVDA